MRQPPRSVRVATIVAVVLALASMLGADGPMTEEEVVRMFVAGATEPEILREIERREPDFDVSPEMLEELRKVDLPESVIAAMVQRHDAVAIEEPPEPAPPAPKGPPVLRVVINPDRSSDKPSFLSIREEVDPQLAAEWELGNAPGDRTFAGIALYLACVADDHVPHQWRSKSPLGRDFFSTSRHRMLAFEAVSSPDDRLGGKLKLELPRSIESVMEPGETHDVILGVALQVAGRYYNWISDSSPGVTVGPDDVTLGAVVKGKGTGSFKVRFLPREKR